MHSGPFVDTLADYIAIFVLIAVPPLLLYAFWMIHILPEKIAERRGHPQADAIKALCLLSLVFGGMLWPLAWLWAYSKPVLHTMAYGTDRATPEAPPKETGSGTGGGSGSAAGTADTPFVQQPAAAPRS